MREPRAYLRRTHLFLPHGRVGPEPGSRVQRLKRGDVSEAMRFSKPDPKWTHNGTLDDLPVGHLARAHAWRRSIPRDEKFVGALRSKSRARSVLTMFSLVGSLLESLASVRTVMFSGR